VELVGHSTQGGSLITLGAVGLTHGIRRMDTIYRAVSRQIHAILSHYTALIEPLSLDEAYLDVTQDLRGLQTASATAREIRARILQETGLTASAGISYSGESLQGADWSRRRDSNPRPQPAPQRSLRSGSYSVAAPHASSCLCQPRIVEPFTDLRGSDPRAS
jgi:hypothetical protein